MRRQVNGRKASGRVSKYSDAFKVRIATNYLNSDKTMEEIGKEEGFSSSQVSGFVRWYELELKRLKTASEASLPKKMDSDAQEVADLRVQLADALLRLEAAETLIDVAKDELGVDLRKKPGSQQSNV